MEKHVIIWHISKNVFTFTIANQFIQMSVFSSSYEALIDDKGRVVLPAPFKKAMGTMADEKIVIEKGYYQSCLNIYPEKTFSDIEEKIMSPLDLTDEDDIIFHDKFYENHIKVNMAENGRLNIPDNFLRHIIDIEKSKEVVFKGSGNCVKLWSITGYDDYMKGTENLGVLMKKRKSKNQ